MKKKLIFVVAASMLIAGCGKAVSSSNVSTGTSQSVSTSTGTSESASSTSSSSEATDIHKATEAELAAVFTLAYYKNITVDRTATKANTETDKATIVLADTTFRATFAASIDPNLENATTVLATKQYSMNYLLDKTKTSFGFASYSYLTAGEATTHIVSDDYDSCSFVDDNENAIATSANTVFSGSLPIVMPFVSLNFLEDSDLPSASKLVYDANKGVYSETVSSTDDKQGFTFEISFANHVLTSITLTDLHNDHTGNGFDKVVYLYSKKGTTANTLTEVEKTELDKVSDTLLYQLSDTDFARFNVASTYENVQISIKTYKEADLSSLEDTHEGGDIRFGTTEARFVNEKNGRIYTMSLDDDMQNYRYNIYDGAKTPADGSFNKAKVAMPTQTLAENVVYLSSAGYNAYYLPGTKSRFLPKRSAEAGIIGCTYDAALKAYTMTTETNDTYQYRFLNGELIEATWTTTNALSSSVTHRLEVYDYSNWKMTKAGLTEAEKTALAAIA